MNSISICCSPLKLDFKELSIEEKKLFCRLVYRHRKHGHSIQDAQSIAYRQVLEESISFEAGG